MSQLRKDIWQKVWECECCQANVHQQQATEVQENWDGRLDGFCFVCATARCDAIPGECDPRRDRPSP